MLLPSHHRSILHSHHHLPLPWCWRKWASVHRACLPPLALWIPSVSHLSMGTFICSVVFKNGPQTSNTSIIYVKNQKLSRMKGPDTKSDEPLPLWQHWPDFRSKLSKESFTLRNQWICAQTPSFSWYETVGWETWHALGLSIDTDDERSGGTAQGRGRAVTWNVWEHGLQWWKPQPQQKTPRWDFSSKMRKPDNIAARSSENSGNSDQWELRFTFPYFT